MSLETLQVGAGPRMVRPPAEANPHWPHRQWIVPYWTVPYWIRPYWIVIGSALGKTVRKTGKVGASAVMPVA
mgnify:CR=1 FL=1